MWHRRSTEAPVREKTLAHDWISGCLHGGLLLAMALGPGLRGAVQWALQGATWSLSVPVVMQGAADGPDWGSV
ncbi:hypothetical protein [Salinibacter pepae]|jgi:hypothetical protein|uniref:hypothetical protein n=1 Tax=Salinibacter pepae TaxID=3040382 RepID=UPI0021E7387F|nr:hypothetical protein [Salinibacter pepae]